MAGTQTSAPTRKATSTARRPSRPLWRVLAVTIAGLWLVFLYNVAISIAQQFGQALGLPLLTLAPRLLTWTRQQVLPIQAAMLLELLNLLAAVAALTVWLWQIRAQAQLEDEQAAITAADEDFARRIAPLDAKMDEAVGVGYEVAGAVAAARAEAAGTAQDTRDLAAQNLDVAQDTLVGVRDIQQKVADLPHRDDLPLLPVRAFTLPTMGDDSAANFPYVRKPLEQQLDHAKDILAACAGGESAKHALIVTGESNAGKTRFALQVLRECGNLAGWEVLEWNEAYREDRIPALERIADRHLIIFLDDLQNYVPEMPRVAPAGEQTLATDALASPAAATLRALYQRLRPRPSPEQQRRLIVVATCRSERLSAARDSLDWLFTQAECIDLPAFNSDDSSPEAQAIFAAFAAAAAGQSQDLGRIDRSKWDGTFGSLLLGLDDKRAEYERRLIPNAVVILRAMKLLSLAGAPGYTGRRVKAICADVKLFDLPELDTSTAAWDAALDDLLRYQFVTILPIEDDILLRIRKDPAYFTDVITDYPRQDQREPHRRRLLEVFAAIKDPEALFYLGNSWYEDQRSYEAVDAYQQALKLRPSYAAAWNNLGNTFRYQQRYDAAVDVLRHALWIDPTLAAAWSNLGLTLYAQQRYGAAVDAYQQALKLDPTKATAWYNLATTLHKQQRFDEAILALEKARKLYPALFVTEQRFLDTARALQQRYDEALTAFDQALALDPTDVDTLRAKARSLRALGRFAEADAADAHANELDGGPPS